MWRDIFSRGSFHQGRPSEEQHPNFINDHGFLGHECQQYLQGQEGSPTVHQVHRQQPVLHGNFLGSQLLFHSNWVNGSSFHSGISRKEDTPDPTDSANSCKQYHRWLSGLSKAIEATADLTHHPTSFETKISEW
ncbi:hypothetical protein EK904_012924 [Melospiza melodia maxima]|nr:hypothetical protein EK904_012924 [Melospiza melodia maxima]